MRGAHFEEEEGAGDEEDGAHAQEGGVAVAGAEVGGNQVGQGAGGLGAGGADEGAQVDDAHMLALASGGAQVVGDGPVHGEDDAHRAAHNAGYQHGEQVGVDEHHRHGAGGNHRYADIKHGAASDAVGDPAGGVGGEGEHTADADDGDAEGLGRVVHAHFVAQEEEAVGGEDDHRAQEGAAGGDEPGQLGVQARHCGGFGEGHIGAVEGGGGGGAGKARPAQDGQRSNAGGAHYHGGEHGQGGPEPGDAVGAGVVSDHQSGEEEDAGAAGGFQQGFDGGGDAHSGDGHQVADAGEVGGVADAGVGLDEYPDNEEAGVVEGRGQGGEAHRDADGGPEEVGEAASDAGTGAVAGPADGNLGDGGGEESGESHQAEEGVFGGGRGDFQHQDGDDDGVHRQDEAGHSEAVGVEADEGELAPGVGGRRGGGGRHRVCVHSGRYELEGRAAPTGVGRAASGGGVGGGSGQALKATRTIFCSRARAIAVAISVRSCSPMTPMKATPRSRPTRKSITVEDSSPTGPPWRT